MASRVSMRTVVVVVGAAVTGGTTVVVGAALVVVVGGIVVVLGSVGATSTIGPRRSIVAAAVGGRSRWRDATMARSVPTTLTANVSSNAFPHPRAPIALPL